MCAIHTRAIARWLRTFDKKQDSTWCARFERNRNGDQNHLLLPSRSTDVFRLLVKSENGVCIYPCISGAGAKRYELRLHMPVCRIMPAC